MLCSKNTCWIFFLPESLEFQVELISKECQIGWGSPHFVLVASGIIFWPPSTMKQTKTTKLLIQLGGKGRLSDECICSKEGGGRFKFWDTWICERWFYTLYHAKSLLNHHLGEHFFPDWIIVSKFKKITPKGAYNDDGIHELSRSMSSKICSYFFSSISVSIF